MALTTLTTEQIDRIPEDILPQVIGIGGIGPHDADASYEAIGLDCEDGRHETTAYGLIVGSRLLLWCSTPEAGITETDTLDSDDWSAEELDDLVRTHCHESIEIWGTVAA